MNPAQRSLTLPAPAWRHLATAAAAVFAAVSAQAAVTLSTPPTAAGDFASIGYGNGGDVFALEPYLFVSGLGGANDARSVINGNPALAWSFASQGVSASLLTVDFTVTNTSATESFSDLRFMVFANPDGDQTAFLDVVGEAWGPAAATDPVRREVMALPTLTNIVSGFKANNNLTDGPPGADCTAAAGCDAIVGLQWNAPALGPRQKFVIQVGLADDGTSLSGRYLTATAVDSAATVLTFSGTGIVTAVPEPSTWAMLLGGLGGLGALGLAVRRRAG